MRNNTTIDYPVIVQDCEVQVAVTVRSWGGMCDSRGRAAAAAATTGMGVVAATNSAVEFEVCRGWPGMENVPPCPSSN